MKRLLVAGLAVVCAATCAGMRGAHADDVGLDKIIVTTRSEESLGSVSRVVDVVTAQDIAASGATSVADVLRRLPAVTVNTNGGVGAQSTIRMRGATAAEVLVIVDGRPVNSPRDGEVDLSTIPLSDIDRIEVMHGGGSSLYGSSAMGGIINIVTKRPPVEGFTTQGETAFGTFRTYTEHLSHGGKIHGLGYMLSGDYVSSEGARQNSAHLAKDFNGKFDYDLNDDVTVGARGGFYRGDTGTPGPTASLDLDDKQSVSKNYAALDGSWKATDRTTVTGQAYQNYDRLKFMENLPGGLFDTPFENAVHVTTVRGVDIQARQEITDHYQVTGGLNYVANRNDSNESVKHKYQVRAAFLSATLKFTDALKADVGVREDDYSNFGSQTSPSLSARYQVNDKVALRGGVTKSFRAPTFNDLYWPDQGWAKGNPGLQPETAWTQEAGIEVKPNKYLETGMTYFHSNFKDLINWTPDSTGVWMPQNVGTAVIDGIELTQKVFPVSWFAMSAGYTFMRPRDAKAHEDLTYQPQDKADYSLKYMMRGFMAELTGQYTGLRFEDAANTVKVKKFYTMDINLAEKFNDTVTVFCWMKNLLNKRYEVIRDFPMPGFSITGGLKLEF